jgi:phytoene dehydrogenase-like protein
LTAAIILARAGLSVQVFEAADVIGGGARSAEVTLPGFTHDLFSAIHPTSYCSPVFRSFPLEQHGLKWVHSPAALAHPMEDHSAVMLEESVEGTARQFPEDAETYRSIFEPARMALADLLDAGPKALTRHSLEVAFLGTHALRSGASLLKKFQTPSARALLAGITAHSMLPLNKLLTAGIGIALTTMGHVGGWPFPQGGAQKISDALASYFRSLSGEITTGVRVQSLRELPSARAVLLDLTPRQVLEIGGDDLPSMYTQVLRNFKYGLGAFKVDWALSEAVPWRSPAVKRAATLHIGGGMEEIAHREREAWFGRTSGKPFIIAAQHSLFDRTRAPEGKHTLWGYCHLPNGSQVDMLERIEEQIERFAPGFRDCILARNVMPPKRLEAMNANLVGGDIIAGRQDIWQMISRPSVRYWCTPLKNLFICSASTPPGGGVHGMCGYFAAQVALKKRFGVSAAPLFVEAA